MPRTNSRKEAAPTRSRVVDSVTHALYEVVTSVPSTVEPKSDRPRERAREIQAAAAWKAALISGTLALPSGPLGLATILPDLVSVWRLQAQMVADIGGAYGKVKRLGREQMLYCLFRHAAAQAMRDLASRVGERLVFHPTTLRVLESVTRKLGLRVTERVLAKSVARWLPLIGSAGVAGYAYYDTTQVAATAIELFEQADFSTRPAAPVETSGEAAGSDETTKPDETFEAPAP